MSGRYSDQYIYAFDTQGKGYLIYRGYGYSNGAGDYHDSVCINGRTYEQRACVEDDEPYMTRGEKLPCAVYPKDIRSYFTANPTPVMREVTDINGMSDLNIAYFADIVIESVPAGPYEAECVIVDKNGISRHEHDIEKESLGDDAETVARNLFEKYSPDANR